MKNQQILISIIIPLYNSEEFLSITIESIIKQDYCNIELIIVDDGSTDNSKEIVYKYMAEDSRITYVYQSNMGAPAARNKGLKISKGEYILFFDADDVLLPYSISKFIQNSSNKDLLIGDYLNINEKGVLRNDNTNYHFKTIFSKKINSNLFNHLPFFDPLPGNKMYKKKFLLENKITFSELKIGQDLNFYLKVIGNSPSYSLIDENIFHYRIHADSISNSYTESILDIIKSINEVELKKYVFFENNRSILETIKLNHYILQLFKVPYISNKNERIKVYGLLKKSLKSLNKQLINKQMITMNTNKANFAVKFGVLYTSNIFRSYLDKRKNI